MISGGRSILGPAQAASLVSVAALYDVLELDDPLVVGTVRAVEDELTSGPGPTGVHRYPSDTFYAGGQWPVLACLLAWHHARAGSLPRAAELLQWVADTADADQLLPSRSVRGWHRSAWPSGSSEGA